jgi:hypothetical protein
MYGGTRANSSPVLHEAGIREQQVSSPRKKSEDQNQKILVASDARTAAPTH